MVKKLISHLKVKVKVKVKMYIDVQNNETAEQFKEKSKKGYWVILYYANWCPHCQTMKPEWKKFGNKYEYDTQINVAEVESQFLEEIGDEHKSRVQGYPTVMLAKNGKSIAGHEGPRTADSFDEFANSNIVNVSRTKMFNLSGNDVKEININTLLRNEIAKKPSSKKTGSKKKGKKTGSKKTGLKKTGSKKGLKKTGSKKRKAKGKK